jgi:pantetheine-phosphate adenylyltransferase
MRRAIYPGSFDPVTNGHLDIIERGIQLFDEVVVAVAENSQKKESLFSPGERVEMLESLLANRAELKISHFNGLLVEFARETGACAIIRGLRAVSDFEFEFQMALMNRKLADNVETIFLMPREDYTYLSSRIVKEIARLGGKVDAFVPKLVAEALHCKFHA